MELNVGYIAFMAVVMTCGLIIITEVYGKRRAKKTYKYLEFLAITPLILIILRFLIVFVINADDTVAINQASINASNEIIELIPGFIIDSIIGEIIGAALWAIYRFLK